MPPKKGDYFRLNSFIVKTKLGKRVRIKLAHLSLFIEEQSDQGLCYCFLQQITTTQLAIAVYSHETSQDKLPEA